MDTHKDLEKYLKLLVHHVMLGRVAQQVEALQRGLSAVIPQSLLSTCGICFSAEEFGVLIAGVAELDLAAVNDWEAHTNFRGYRPDDLVVRHFWSVVRNAFIPRERAALLRFVHGSFCVPARGFASLQGYAGGLHPFTLVRCPAPADGSEARQAYPRAQTCFNTLHLPSYSTVAEMELRLRAVIDVGAGCFDEGAVVAA